MDTRFASETEQQNWNKRIAANPDGGNIFQSYEFARQKQLGGWTPRFVMIGSMAVTVLEKSFLGFKFWYIPKGPGIHNARQLKDTLSHLTKFVHRHNVFMIKIEPELLDSRETTASLAKLGLIKTRPIQPNFSTITLDISNELEVVMAHLNQKGRHAIRRAERDGVTVKRVPSNEKNCKLMYTLLAQTAAGSFSIRSYNYYKEFWQRFEKAGLGQLFFAYVNGNPVAGAYALVLGEKSTYKDGASVRNRTVYGASHLLQWEVIKWAKEKGSRIHDLCGAPPSNQINNPEHPHYGIGRFKTSFNKEVTDYVGAYDIAVRPFIYKLWTRIGERVALRLHRAYYHEDYY